MDTGIAAAGGPMGEEEATPGQGDHWNPGSLQLQLRTVNHDGEMADIHTMAFSQGMGGIPAGAHSCNNTQQVPRLPGAQGVLPLLQC